MGRDVTAAIVSLLSAFIAVVGVIVGSLLTRRSESRQWLRDKQLQAYQDLFQQTSTFLMTINRAHRDQAGWDYDWSKWASALVTASLVAPTDVAVQIDRYGRSMNSLLDANADRRSTENPLTLEELEVLMDPISRAQVATVDAMRRSFGQEEPLVLPVGGVPVSTEFSREQQRRADTGS